MSYNLPRGYISPSQINSWRDCGKCYELGYIQRVPKFASIHFAIGGGLHKSVEYVARRITDDQEPNLDEALELGIQEFEKRTSAPEDEESGAPMELDLARYDSEDAAKDDTVKFIQCALREVPKLMRERGIISVETDLGDLPEDVLKATFPFPVRARLDALYGDKEEMVPNAMTDYKTSSKRGGPDENGALQFSFYGLPAWVAGSPWRIGADVLVKTKVPELLTYWANGTGHLTDENYKVAQEIILYTAERISKGDFPIGKGWNGKHDYEHGLCAFSVAVSGFGDAA